MNGVPIRRVNKAYVIATSTKIDISSVDASKFTDKYFEKEVIRKKKTESEFFEAEKEVTIFFVYFDPDNNGFPTAFRSKCFL